VILDRALRISERPHGPYFRATPSRPLSPLPPHLRPVDGESADDFCLSAFLGRFREHPTCQGLRWPVDTSRTPLQPELQGSATGDPLRCLSSKRRASLVTSTAFASLSPAITASCSAVLMPFPWQRCEHDARLLPIRRKASLPAWPATGV